jgi:hypothetical protein
MKKLLLYISVPLLLSAACTKDISKYNDITKSPSDVPAGTLVNNAVKSIADGLANASVNINVFRFTVKHWAMTTYQDEAQYDFTTRAIPDAWWARFYRDALIDLNQAKNLITADNSLNDVVKSNQLATVDLLEVYAFSVMVNTFGDVPYSDALGDAAFPTYDDAKTIYTDLIKRAEADLMALNTSATGLVAAQDLIYGGSVSGWKQFAASLTLRLGMTIADADDAAAKSAVELAAASGNLFQTFDESAKFTYLSSSPNTNPLYTDIILGGRGDYVAAKDLMDVLISLNDPRKTHYFKPNNAGNYVGGVVGASNVLGNTAQPSSQITDPAAPSYIIDYVETEFYLAEAKERGYTVSGTATEHYNNAIKASIISWGGTDDEATTYLASTQVAYATATGTWKQKIGTQKWLALYNRPYEGWTELRRLDFPVLTPPVDAVSSFPTRFTYPVNEQQTNNKNYTAAAAAIGGDLVTTKIFWDKY